MRSQTMITVKDVAASRTFYENALGLKSGHGGDEYDQLYSGHELVLQLHNMEEDMNHGPLLEPGEKPGGGVLLWFQTDDFEPVVERLNAMRVSFIKPPFENPYALHMEVWFNDPDGYRVVVAGPSAHGSKAPG